MDLHYHYFCRSLSSRTRTARRRRGRAPRPPPTRARHRRRLPLGAPHAASSAQTPRHEASRGASCDATTRPARPLTPAPPGPPPPPSRNRPGHYFAFARAPPTPAPAPAQPPRAANNYVALHELDAPDARSPPRNQPGPGPPQGQPDASPPREQRPYMVDQEVDDEAFERALHAVRAPPCRRPERGAWSLCPLHGLRTKRELNPSARGASAADARGLGGLGGQERGARPPGPPDAPAAPPRRRAAARRSAARSRSTARRRRAWCVQEREAQLQRGAQGGALCCVGLPRSGMCAHCRRRTELLTPPYPQGGNGARPDAPTIAASPARVGAFDPMAWDARRNPHFQDDTQHRQHQQHQQHQQQQQQQQQPHWAGPGGGATSKGARRSDLGAGVPLVDELVDTLHVRLPPPPPTACVQTGRDASARPVLTGRDRCRGRWLESSLRASRTPCPTPAVRAAGRRGRVGLRRTRAATRSAPPRPGRRRPGRPHVRAPRDTRPTCQDFMSLS
jgi:hypothetical protein